MLAEFISLIRQHIDRAIYVWGGQGEIVISESQIRRMEQSESDTLRAIALWNRRKAAGIYPVKMFDCSGLIIWALQSLKLIDHDMTAHGLYTMSKPTAAPQIGDFTFMVDRYGHAYHVGIVTRAGYVTEAKGRDDGVVERPIGTAWKAFGKNPFIDTSIQEVSDILQKGDKSASVKSWQEALIKLSFPVGSYGADGSFGPATEQATLAFQTHYSLPVTGIVDAATAAKAWDALRLLSVPTADTTELNAIKAQITSLTAETVAAKAGQLAAEQAASLARSALTALNDRVAQIKAGRDALAGL